MSSQFCFPHEAKPRIFARCLGGGRRTSENATWAELEFELGVLRIVGVLGLILGVEVIKIAEELVETVHGRQELIAIAEMVLAELSSRVAEGLEQLR